jgi:uncharacterized protein
VAALAAAFAVAVVTTPAGISGAVLLLPFPSVTPTNLVYSVIATARERTAGVALGIGGLAGACTGARIQGRLPEALIRGMVGVLVIAIGARYLWSGLS